VPEGSTLPMSGWMLQLSAFSALQDKGKLNILSSPSITTLDNQTAFIESGEEIPFQTVEDGEVTRIVADPQDVDCEGVTERTSLIPLVVEWNPKLKCWQADCGDSSVVVNMSGHYRGPSLVAA